MYVNTDSMLIIFRNQTVKKLTMGYTTNYSYCTATVSGIATDEGNKPCLVIMK